MRVTGLPRFDASLPQDVAVRVRRGPRGLVFLGLVAWALLTAGLWIASTPRQVTSAPAQSTR